MSSSPSAKQWIVIILVNILVSSLTAFFVFRTLVTGAQPGDVPSAAASGVAAAEAPALSPSPSPPSPEAQAGGPVTPTANLTPTLTPAPAAEEAAPAAVAAAVADAAAPAQAGATATPVLTPTAAQARVRISAILFPGQLTREVAVLVNEGDEADLTGWVLSTSNGNAYTFGNVTLFKDSFINLRSTTGADVPTDLYWNRTEPAWKAGDTLTLSRGNETVATFSVPVR